MTLEPHEPRKLRADAERNRELLVEAARTVFSQQGLDAPLDEIAKHAQVGNATMYRRFATRDDLIFAAFAPIVQANIIAVKEALKQEDSWKGFCQYTRYAFELQSQDRGISELLGSRLTRSIEPFEPLRTKIYTAMSKLIARAVDDGHLRADFQIEDLLVLMTANAAVISHTSTDSPNAWKRFVQLAFDGLRAEPPVSTPLFDDEKQHSESPSPD
ncbi:TetR/AcrR family transcriptional regulator [Rhodococcus erythropolis]|uniref:TetR/AcrR family transcriptional regulator n=1 Tax=Rhodococcus erythropolis TaxID=1833 RepID=UPI00378855F1